jgi:hypothetical protein
MLNNFAFAKGGRYNSVARKLYFIEVRRVQYTLSWTQIMLDIHQAADRGQVKQKPTPPNKIKTQTNPSRPAGRWCDRAGSRLCAVCCVLLPVSHSISSISISIIPWISILDPGFSISRIGFDLDFGFYFRFYFGFSISLLNNR